MLFGGCEIQVSHRRRFELAAANLSVERRIVYTMTDIINMVKYGMVDATYEL